MSGVSADLNPYKNSLLKNGDADQLQLRMMIENSNKSASCFPDRVQIDLKARDVNIVANI